MADEIIAVEFHGANLTAFLHGGRACVALRPIVVAMGLDWEGQHARITRHPVLGASIFVIEMQLPGDVQRRRVTCLPLEMLNGWLFGIDTRRVRPELREKIVAYQTECFEVLARHFGMLPSRQAAPALTTEDHPLRSALEHGRWLVTFQAGRASMTQVANDQGVFRYEDIPGLMADMPT
ncbi:MAG: phage antirepressor N-terminal domain-containing protein, partial [Aquincola sp.]|nr:phage antirepressor N-terminal domain-containing protein [Aquincola sp.]